MVIAVMKLRKHLPLVRKAMTNVDSLLKRRVITLLTKVHLVKAMVFPVVMLEMEMATNSSILAWEISWVNMNPPRVYTFV